MRLQRQARSSQRPAHLLLRDEGAAHYRVDRRFHERRADRFFLLLLAGVAKRDESRLSWQDRGKERHAHDMMDGDRIRCAIRARERDRAWTDGRPLAARVSEACH